MSLTPIIEWSEVALEAVVDFFDHKRVPLNGEQRRQRQGVFPYYGAQGVIDHVDGYLFDGRYILVAEDGENLNSRKLPLALVAQGRFWVNNHAHIVRGKPGVADDIYLLHALNTTDIRPYVTGAAQPKLSQANLKRVSLLLPPLAEQRRIASILAAYDDLIENCQRRIRILEDMARGLYREWFVHFRFPGADNMARVDSPLGTILQGWRICQLDALCVADSGIQTGPFGSQLHEADYSTEGVPVVMPRDLIDFRITLDKVARIPDATAERLARHRMLPGDIVYGRRGDIGRRAYLMPYQAGWLCGTGCLRVRPDPESVNGWFLFNYLGQDDVAASIAKRAHGATMPNLNTKLLATVPIATPPREIQEQFGRKTLLMATSREQFFDKITNLRRTRDLLLPRLMSGQIDLRAAENAVPT